MRYNKTRKALIFWCLFIGIGAVAGATGMLVDPSGKVLGMDAMLPYFRVLPLADILYQNFTFPGIALLVVNGITNIVAAILLFKKKKLGIILGGMWGVTLMMWIAIQLVIFPLNFMSTIYFIFGFIQAITGYMCYVFYRQEVFQVREDDYTNIGTNKKELVVYFSRMGYTKKLALACADQSGADVLEIKAAERTEGTPGFWWCGRFAMHRWRMPIEPIEKDLSTYEKVTICTPIWVFNVAAPVREFCYLNQGKLKRVDYIVTHFMKAKFRNAAKEMNHILKIQNGQLESVCLRFGREVKNIEKTNQGIERR